MEGKRKTVGVISGKGGVGKTSLTASIANLTKDDVEIHLDFKKGSPLSMLNQLNRAAISKYEHEGQQLLIHTKQPYLVLFGILQLIRAQNYQIKTIEVHRPSLKEVFELLEKK